MPEFGQTCRVTVRQLFFRKAKQASRHARILYVSFGLAVLPACSGCRFSRRCRHHLRQFDSRFHAHFLEQVGTVHFDGPHADIQFVGDDLVQLAGENPLHDLPFPRRESRQPLPG